MLTRRRIIQAIPAAGALSLFGPITHALEGRVTPRPRRVIPEKLRQAVRLLREDPETMGWLKPNPVFGFLREGPKVTLQIPLRYYRGLWDYPFDLESPEYQKRSAREIAEGLKWGIGLSGALVPLIRRYS